MYHSVDFITGEILFPSAFFCQIFGITMVCGHREFGKQVSVFEVGKRFYGGKLSKSR